MTDLRLPLLAMSLATLCLAACATADPQRWTLTNHAGAYRQELVRLGIQPPTPYDARQLVVTENGREVPYQVEVLRGTPQRVEEGHIWVAATIASRESHEYTLAAGRPAGQQEPLVRVGRNQDAIALGNRLIEVYVPSRHRGGQIPPPVLGIAEGVVGPRGFRGRGGWRTDLTLRSFSSEVIGEGPLFAKVRLRYEFEPTDGIDAPFSEITITVPPDRPYVLIEESHRMPEGDAWTFDASAGWDVTGGLIRGWHEGAFRGNESLREVELKPSERLGNSLIWLQPRWTQGYDQGWFFGAVDANWVVGAMVLRAGKWYWPHDNLIDVRVDESGTSAVLTMPTRHGRRYWALLTGPRQMVQTVEGPPDERGRTRRNDNLRDLAYLAGMAPLDKLTHEYILDWPGLEPGGFAGQWFYGNNTNPTGVIRQIGRNAVRDAQGGSFRPSRQNLSTVQVYLDPDWYGSYWDRWGMINPNFWTDFIRIPVATAAMVKDHPRFEEIARMAEEALRTDMLHSVTLPGGAGQESPGYTAHALGGWRAMAPICREHLGFDPTTWPRYRAAASFLLRTSQPLGGGRRRILPLGDTHPTGPDVVAIAREAGVNDRIEDFVTEELPGFGVVFRNHPGTDRETFLAFKSGPNRIHNHGDQLSFHYIGEGRRMAIDHMCSYAPRADQEHMHNRVAFGTDRFKWANMDGYERLIAFTTDDAIDVAVGQVESRRIREQKPFPPADWDQHGPYQHFDETIVYRRTIAQVKPTANSNALTYFVIRDQHWGPQLDATYALHVPSDKADRDGQRVDFGNMTLYVAEPAQFDYDRHDWSFTARNYSESTVGVRLTVRGRQTQFVTVLYPSGRAPRMEAIPGGVRVHLPGGATDEITFSDALGADASSAGELDAPLVTLRRSGRDLVALRTGDVDLDRSQGSIGLFVPTVGYDFGPIPDWLMRQRELPRDAAWQD